MRYACYYYSATGNTKRAVTLVGRRLAAAGSTVDMTMIRKGMEPPRPDGYDGIIVAFPVFSFSPPVFVKRFLRRLPAGNAMPAHVLAVDGGGGRSAAAMAVRILERRGYKAAASGRASYPDNWVQAYQPPAEAEVDAMTAYGDQMTAAFASTLVAGPGAGKADHRVSPIDAVVAFLFGTIGRRFLGKTFYADEDCDACGICVSGCPAGAIILKKGSGEQGGSRARPGTWRAQGGREQGGSRARPFWKMSCEDCCACINRCPRRAINTSIGRFLVLVAVITVLIVFGLRGWRELLKPLMTGLAPVLMRITDVVAVTAIVLASHLAFGPVDRFLLRFIQRIPGVRRFFSWTFTKGWRRYKAKTLGD